MLVIVALLLGLLPPGENMRSPRFEPLIAQAQEAATTSLEEVMEPPDEPAPSLDEPSGGLLATKMADPELVSPGDLITYTIVLTNTTEAMMEGLVVSDPLPDGLAYMPGSAGSGVYDPGTKTLTWDISELAAGESLPLSFQARVRGDVLDELVVNLAEVTGGGLDDPVQAQATVAVLSRVLITPQGGELVSRSGRVRAEFPGGAVPQPIWAIYRLREVHQLPPSQPGLALRFDLTGEVATDENTAPPFTQFEKPVRLTVDLTELVDEEALGEYQRLFVGYLDEATGHWVHLPVVEQQEGPVLTVEVDHFTTFGGGVYVGDSMEGFAPDYIPSVTSAQPALFTGDATYALPLYVPPGPGGLQPDLMLRYSSGDVSEAWLAGESSPWGDNRHESSQPGWLGQGWSLNFGVIVRDMEGQELKNAEWEEHTYWLNMNSVSGKLVKASDGYYYPEFAPQWRLYWTEADDHRNGTWTAYGPGGTRYTFDELMQVIEWDGCTPNDATMRWYLSTVEDRSGNTITFTYDKKKRNTGMPGCSPDEYDRAMYPATITYGDSNVRVEFVLDAETRNDFNPEWDTIGPQVRYHKEVLDKILIKVKDGGSGPFETVRAYAFEYYTTSWGTDPEWLTLWKVRTVGRDGSELPTIEFIYKEAGDYEGMGDGHRKRKVLTEINNGYGGQVKFTYEWPDPLWYYKQNGGGVRRFRLRERKAYDGINPGCVQRSLYNYYDPYGCGERMEFWGHAQVWETVYDGSTKVTRTVTDFYQECEYDSCYVHLDPRQGRAKKISKYECPTTACDAEVYRVENTWGFAEAPEKEVVEGNWRVWQVMPVASSTYYYADQNEVRDWTLYLDDPYGNPAARFEYGIFAGDTSLDDTGTLTELKCAGFDDDNCLGNPGDDWEKWNRWAVWVEDGVSVSWVGHQVTTARASAGDTTGVVYQGLDDNLEPDTEYQVTAWVRGSPTNSAQAEIYVQNSGGWGWINTTAVPGENWQLLRVVFTTDSSANPDMVVHLAANFDDGAGTIYWDNVTIAEVDTTGNDERTTHWQYYPNTTDWIVNKVARETVYSGIQAEDDSGSSIVARTRYHYDMNNGDTGWQVKPTQGLLTQVDRWESGTTYYNTGYRYDDDGNLIQVIDPNENTTTTSYDTVFHTFPTSVTNAKLHETTTEYYGVNGSSMTSTGAYFGQVESVTDPNEAETKYRYDVFGRLTKVIRHDDSDTDPTVEYVYDDFYPGPTTRLQAFYQETSGCSGCQRRMLTFYNGLGQKIQTKAEAKDGTEVVVTNTSYDERGLVKEESMPYFSSTNLWEYVTPDMSNKTSYEYDGLGRVKKVTHPDGTTVQMAYDGWQRAVLDEKGHQKIYENDGLGRLVSVTEYEGSYGTPNFEATVYATTDYSYDVMDNLEQVTDEADNQTTMMYDGLGRKTQITDPDMGTWSYDYDAAGNLTRQTDARGQTICFYYDALNRLQGKTYRMDTNCPSDPGYPGYAVAYAYDDFLEDADAAKSWGRRRATWAGSLLSNGHKYQYDERGRLIEETQTVNNADYVTQYTYYADDQVHTMTYPDGEETTITYNARGLPETLTSSLEETYVTDDTSYTPEGRLDLLSLGSGLRVDYEYYDWVTPNGQGRLESIRSGTAGQPTLLQTLSYAYDAVGNVARITDGDVATDFSYDALDRLTGASGAYTASYTYNKIGNITSWDEGVKVWYYYESSKPHAVTTVGVPPWYIKGSYSYDDNGNMTSRYVDGTTHTLTYDAENRLQTVTNTATGKVTTFTYDADGRRVIRDTVAETIVYVGSHYEEHVPKQVINIAEDLDGDCDVDVADIMLVAGCWHISVGDPDCDAAYDLDDDGDIDIVDIMKVVAHWGETCLVAETVKYYTLGGKRVAMRKVPADPPGQVGTLYYLFSDHLGSSSVSYRADGQETITQRYHPWGTIRPGPDNALPTDYTFTGQKLDESTGLMYYGARYYDPALGRFVQADTIVPEPGNPQALNRYSYVLNNPLRYIDPTGHQPTKWLKSVIRWAQPHVYRWTGPGSPLYSHCFSVGWASVSIRDINNRLGDIAMWGLRSSEIQRAAQDAGVPTILLAAALHHQGGSPDLRDLIVMNVGLESEEDLSRGIGQIMIREAEEYNRIGLVLDPVPDETLAEALYIREVSVRYMAAKLKESSQLIDEYLQKPRYSTISLSEENRWLLLMATQNLGKTSVIRFFDVCGGDWSCWFADWGIYSQVLNMRDDIAWLEEHGWTE